MKGRRTAVEGLRFLVPGCFDVVAESLRDDWEVALLGIQQLGRWGNRWWFLKIGVLFFFFFGGGGVRK